MAKPITNRVKMGKTPVIRKDLEGGVIAEANNDGSIYVDKSVKKGSPLEKEAIAHEKVHLNQMKRGDLNYDDNNVYWKGKAYPRSSMNEGAKNLPWEKEAYDKTKHMKNKKKSAPTKMSDADLVENNKQTHVKLKRIGRGKKAKVVSNVPLKMSDADLVANNAQTHKKFTNYGDVIKGKPTSSTEEEGGNGGNDELSVIEKQLQKQKVKKHKKELASNNLKSKGIDVDLPGPNVPAPMDMIPTTPITMKATPITMKSRRDYNSPLNYNSPLKDNGTTASKEYIEDSRKVIRDGIYGTLYTTRGKSSSSSKGSSNVTKAPPGTKQTDDIAGYMKTLREKFPNATGSELAKNDWLSSAGGAAYDKKYPNVSGTSDSESSLESSRFVPDTIVVKGTPGTPGTYNMPFYEARNLNLAAKQKRQTQNRDLRQSKRDYYKSEKRITGEKTKRKDRKLINPETNLPFETVKEFMEYRAKARSNMQAKAGKNYGATTGTPDTTRKATADDAPEGTTVIDSKTNLAKIKNTSNQKDVKLSEGSSLTKDKQITGLIGKSAFGMNSNKNKTPFKMGGFGSKTYNK